VSDKESQVSETRTLEIPSWVPGPIASLAQQLYAEAIVRPMWPDFQRFHDHADALRKFATDKRMEKVWNEIYRRQGGKQREGGYVHAAIAARICASPHFRAVEHISCQLSDRDRVQEQAAAVLFLAVTGNALWDRRFDVGPRTRTCAEIHQEIAKRDELAAALEASAEGCQQLGEWHAAVTLRELAAKIRKVTEALRPDPRNPWIVQRKSERVGDEWVRGFIIETTQTCLLLFDKKMAGTVAKLTNIAFDRHDVKRGAIQGVVKHIP